MIKKAFRDLIVANAAITAQLATHEFTTGTAAPAVFTSRVIPRDVERPAVIITQFSGVPWGCRDSRGSDTLIDVDVWGNKKQSDKALGDLAHDVWRLLDRATLTISGYTGVLCMADSPWQREDEDEFPGYLIRCRVLILEDE
jgi:hypothetical protein